ncbi:calcium-binding protein [Chitinilyticum piscinae]|uniref:Calcium-binding protein n=1 Tax=Chitinilyticum piscinae TaxID=2866724 RepID=A0A8J7K8W8_9NEIS|nr:calcium-binding protein [Chitinilyticum piscinae]MBE9610318.1 calcium-binding protein [Chitinilyticum piscinae]
MASYYAKEFYNYTTATGTTGNDYFQPNVGDSTTTALAGNDYLFIHNGGNHIADMGDGNDLVEIGSVGSSRINLGAGNDTLEVWGWNADNKSSVHVIGGAGNDVIIAGDGSSFDRIDYSYVTSTTGFNINLDAGIATSGAEKDLISGFELVVGTKNADTIVGDEKSNVLGGGAGNDKLYGGAGGDELEAGAGNDYVDGGANDGFGWSADWYEVYSDAAMRVDLTKQGVGQLVSTLEGTDTLVGIENVRTGQGDDVIIGDAVDNSLNGGMGKDTITGGAGNDTLRGNWEQEQAADSLVGGTGNDYYQISSGDIVVEAADAGWDRVYSDIDYTLGANLEGLILGGRARNGNGNFLANQLDGNSVANNLYGGAGDDSISGGGGSDTLIGSTGTDQLTGGTGADTFDFNALSELGLNGTKDMIMDFAIWQDDKIDLSSIDTNAALAGDQAFTFSSTVPVAGGGLNKVWFNGCINISIDADNTAEYQIELVGLTSVTADSFIL